MKQVADLVKQVQRGDRDGETPGGVCLEQIVKSSLRQGLFADVDTSSDVVHTKQPTTLAGRAGGGGKGNCCRANFKPH